MRFNVMIAAAVLLLLVPAASSGGWFVDVEAGAAFPGYNDVQVPNDSTGTRFSLSDALDIDPAATVRFRAGLNTGRHTISVFASPLRLNGSGVLAEDIDFNGETFTSGQNVDGLYRFDSYRLTWRYNLVNNPGLSFSGGLTAKLRDAEIKLESGNTSTSKTNTGFVPLFSFQLRWTPVCSWSLLLDGDALVGPVGRAEDVLLAAVYSASPKLDLRAGYRIIEGGADVAEVYNFTLVSFVTAGVNYRF